MRFRHVHLLPPVGVLLGALVVAGCGGSAGPTGLGGTSPAVTSGPAGSGSTTFSGATAPAASTGGAAIDACALLTDADIKEITGFGVAKVIPNPPDTIFPSACEWHVAGAAWQIVLGVSSPGGQATWNSLVPYTQGDPVNGIADEAFLAEMGGDLMVRRGDTFIDVQYVAVGEPKDTQDRLAKRVLEHLP